MPSSTDKTDPIWLRVMERVPFPVRIAATVWLLVSLVFFIAPDVASNLSPALALFVTLPMALVAFGTGLFILWAGANTIGDTVRSVAARKEDSDAPPKRSIAFIGGMGALQIYMMLYMLIGFWLASLSGSYALSTILSALLGVGLGYALFYRKPHPSNVKIFLGGGLFITVLFGILMATVAVPPT